MRKRRALQWGGSAALVVGALLLARPWLSGNLAPATVPPVDVTENAMRLQQPHTGVAAPLPSYVTGLENLPASLRDIEPDGQLRVDDNGQLVLDGDVRRLFDFFLNAVGEESIEQIVARMRAYIRTQLPADAAEQALQILDEYLALRQAFTEAEQDAALQAHWRNDSDLSASTLRQRKDAIRELRSRYLSPATDQAFYTAEDQFDGFTLAKLELLDDTTLTPAQRAEHIALLEAQLPAELQQQIAAVSRLQTLQRLQNDWEQQRGDGAELRLIRESIVGADAADRLEQLAQQRADWRGRMDDWLQQREQILANPALSSTDQQQQLEQERATRFAPEEWQRVQALERLQDQNTN